VSVHGARGQGTKTGVGGKAHIRSTIVVLYSGGLLRGGRFTKRFRPFCARAPALFSRIYFFRPYTPTRGHTVMFRARTERDRGRITLHHTHTHVRPSATRDTASGKFRSGRIGKLGGIHTRILLTRERVIYIYIFMTRAYVRIIFEYETCGCNRPYTYIDALYTIVSTLPISRLYRPYRFIAGLRF